MSSIRRLALAAGLLATAFAAQADDEPSVAGYRHGVYQVIRWNWMPMVAMVRGERPYDAADFRKRAARVSFLSHQLDEAYPEGSGGEHTDALPAIWEDWADFSAKLEDFQREAQALRLAAEGGGEAAVKAQLQKVAGTCKGCHEKYRAD